MVTVMQHGGGGTARRQRRNTAETVQHSIGSNSGGVDESTHGIGDNNGNTTSKVERSMIAEGLWQHRRS
jgi:hypothetical protein